MHGLQQIIYANEAAYQRAKSFALKARTKTQVAKLTEAGKLAPAPAPTAK